jgi:hypothetical protein
MRYDDEFSGDEIMGDDVLGDEIVGAEEIVGDDGYISGDELMGDEGYVSGDELMGDDVLGDEIMGRRLFRRRRRRPNRQAQVARMRQHAIMQRRLANAKVIVKKPPTKSRVQSIGFNFKGIGPGDTVDIPARPQVKFRGTRLSVPSSIAPGFLIDDLKVGRSSQFVGSGAQSAETFKDTATSDNIATDTAEPGMDIVLSVTNTTATAQDFHATLFGDAVE